jgi:hypothetical protein
LVCTLSLACWCGAVIKGDLFSGKKAIKTRGNFKLGYVFLHTGTRYLVLLERFLAMLTLLRRMLPVQVKQSYPSFWRFWSCLDGTSFWDTFQ